MKREFLISGFLILFGFIGHTVSAQKDLPIPNPEKYSGPIIDMHLHTGLPHEVPPGSLPFAVLNLAKETVGQSLTQVSS